MSMISKQVEELREESRRMHDVGKYAWAVITRNAADTIEALSAKLAAHNLGQTVAVVRCRDCKHWHEWENGTGSCHRSENGCTRFGVDATDYCSFGEREDA